MSEEYSALKKALHIEFNEKQGLEVHELLNHYRILRRQSWRQMILEALRDMIEQENVPIANVITEYMKVMPTSIGRPKRRVMTTAEKSRKSNAIKRRWEENRKNGLILDKFDLM